VEVALWDCDGTVYPRTIDLDKEIQAAARLLVAIKGGLGLESAYRVYAEDLGRLKSNIAVMQSFGMEFSEIWDWVDLQEHIKPNPNLVAMIDRWKSSGVGQLMVSNGNKPRHLGDKLGLVGFPEDAFDHLIATEEVVGPKWTIPKDVGSFLELLAGSFERNESISDNLEFIEQVGWPKPSIQGFLEGMRLAEVAPWQAVIIGDSEGADMGAAEYLKRYGTWSIQIGGKSEVADFSVEDALGVGELFRV